MKGSSGPLAVQLRGKRKGGLPGHCMAPSESRRVRCLQRQHPAFPSGLLQVSAGQAAARAKLWVYDVLTLTACQTQHTWKVLATLLVGYRHSCLFPRTPC